MDILIYVLETREGARAFEAPAPYLPEQRAA